jgi:hypothetical protein
MIRESLGVLAAVIALISLNAIYARPEFRWSARRARASGAGAGGVTTTPARAGPVGKPALASEARSRRPTSGSQIASLSNSGWPRGGAVRPPARCSAFVPLAGRLTTWRAGLAIAG